jgi:anti-sigma B factor antagonist
MQAKIRKDGDITVVELKGKLGFETAEPFRETCADIPTNSKVIFNLSGLSFVGSSGIGAFVNTLRDLSVGSAVPPKFCHLKSEFKKVFRATDSSFQIFEDESAAVTSFALGTIPLPQLDFLEPEDEDEG